MIHPYRDTRLYWILNLSAAPDWDFIMHLFDKYRNVWTFQFWKLEYWDDGASCKINSWTVIFSWFFVKDKKIVIRYYEQQQQQQEKIRYGVCCILFLLLHKTTLLLHYFKYSEFILNVDFKYKLNINQILPPAIWLFGLVVSNLRGSRFESGCNLYVSDLSESKWLK